MRPHLIIKLHQPLRGTFIPFWRDFIQDKTHVVTKFNNALDAVFEKHGLDFWITREFGRAVEEKATAEEVGAGLDRIYRIIPQGYAPLPPGLTEAIQRLPIVEKVREALVAEAELPRPSFAQRAEGFFDRSRKNIYLPQAHLYTKGSPEVKVAILDTGVDLQHFEIRDAIEKKTDMVQFDGMDTTNFMGDVLEYDDSPDDEVGHGTHVAGIIAGRGARMPEGVAPRCKLIVVRVLATMKQNGNKVGAGLIDNINVGMKWAVDNGADIINMSLGVKHEHGGLPHEEVVQYALKKGVTIVAASGNDGTMDKYYPGALPGVIAVGAVDEDDRIASFSTFGKHVSLVAPGTNILSSFIHGDYAVSSGTSQASPFVAGAIALLKSYGLEHGVRLNDNHVKYILKHTSDKTDSRIRSDKAGYGRINLVDALKLLQYMINNFN